MDFSDFQFGNVEPEFDLTPDIAGSSYQIPVFEEPKTDLPDNFWFQNPSVGSIVRNNDLLGMADNKFGETVDLNENQRVIKKTYVMAMRGANPLDLERTLKLTFSSDAFQSNPLLKNILFLLPMFGSILWACWPFKSEEEARIKLKRKKDIKPILVSECSKCSSCQHRNALSKNKIFCSKFGLPIFGNDFSVPPPKSVVDHLYRAEYLKIKKNKLTWDDVRAAVIFPPKNEEIRIYNQVAPVKKNVLPGAQYRLAIRELNLQHNNKKVAADTFERQLFFRDTCYPLIVKVQELILRIGQNEGAIVDAVGKIFLPDKHRLELKDLASSLLEDVLLWSKLRWYLQPYKKCADALQFLRRTMIRVPFAVQRQECETCLNNKNGYCALLETTLVSYYSEIPERSRLSAIEMIGMEKSIDQNVLGYLKNQERLNPKSGLNKLREVINANKVSQVYTGAGIQDLDKMPNLKTNEEKVIEWIARKIDEGCSILKVESAINEKYGEKKGQKMIQEVLLIKNIQPSVRNELCLTNYELSPGSSIIKIDKCITCSNADNLYCNKYNRTFVPLNTEIPSEVNEIIGYFQDQSFDDSVKIDQKRTEKSINIEMEDPGEFLSIDVRTEKNIDENALWHEAQQQQMEVETPETIQFESSLDIDLGEQGDGMVLGDDLL